MPMIPRDPVSRRQLKLGLLFAGPVLVGSVLFTLYPLLASCFIGGRPVLLSELGDRMEMLRTSTPDPGAGAVCWNALVFAVFSVPLTIFVALIFALLLNLPVRGKGFYQAAFLLPSIVPAVTSALVWQWVFPWHQGLTQPGQINLKYVLILAGLWTAGANMILYRAAMRGISQDLYDAADAEGASLWQCTTQVTLPALAPVLFFTVVLGIVGSFQVFAFPLVLLGTPQNEVNPMTAFARPAHAWALFLTGALCTGAVLFAGKRFLRPHGY